MSHLSISLALSWRERKLVQKAREGRLKRSPIWKAESRRSAISACKCVDQFQAIITPRPEFDSRGGTDSQAAVGGKETLNDKPTVLLNLTVDHRVA